MVLVCLAAFATLIAQGISGGISILIFFSRMRRYKSHFSWFDGQDMFNASELLYSSVLQQSTVSIGMMIVLHGCKSIWYTGTSGLFGNDESRECVFSLIFISIGNAVSPYVSKILVQRKTNVSKGYHAALVLDLLYSSALVSY